MIVCKMSRQGRRGSVCVPGGGTPGQPGVNGALTSLPSPTMPNFSMAQTPNGQPTDHPAIYTNGIHQTYPRKFINCSVIIFLAG